MNDRRERLVKALACPACRAPLRPVDAGFQCTECDKAFANVGAVPCFRTEYDADAEARYMGGWQGWLRSRPRLYEWVFAIFAPVLVTGPNLAKRLAARLGKDALVIDLGAGNDRRDPHFINVDMLPYPEVDVIADGETLPFADGCAAGILSIAVLEHVQDPLQLLGEAKRVLQPGGELVLAVPFLQPFHAAPHDYRRWTRVGLQEELRGAGFTVTDSGVYCGPSSALAWLVAAWWTHLLSLGNERVRRMLSPVVQALFSWLKWPDLLLARMNGSDELASVVWVSARRAEQPKEPPEG